MYEKCLFCEDNYPKIRGSFGKNYLILFYERQRAGRVLRMMFFLF
jgi:hypothetical protein